MKLRALLLIAVQAVFLCGCSPVFENEYIAVTDYDASVYVVPEAELSSISSYAELESVLDLMIVNRQETAELQFNSYEGNISDDLAEACFQVKSNSAIGSYMIDYISYDISQIVSYYNATVYVNYTHSLEELNAIDVISSNMIDNSIVKAVSEKATKLTLQVYTSIIDGAVMEQKAMSAIYNSPELVPVVPKISVEFYPDSSLDHIFDITFIYDGYDLEAEEMNTSLTQAIESITSQIYTETALSSSVSLANYLVSNCEYDPSAKSGSAYDSLVLGKGDSRAVAMGYSALCSAKGINSMVVSGLKDDAEHYWNLIQISNLWYHIDVSSLIGLTNVEVILYNDEQMYRNYRWDEIMYPESNSPVINTEVEPASAVSETSDINQALSPVAEIDLQNNENIS